MYFLVYGLYVYYVDYVYLFVYRWEQPAQGTVPWLKVDGATLQEWRDRWTVEATRLRQQGHHDN